MAAVLIGMKPGLAEACVLVSCPGDLVAWRDGRQAWTRSENPLRWADKVSPSIKVITLTGAGDDKTRPELAQTYIKALKAHGVDASFILVPGENHNSAFSSAAVTDALKTLIKQ